MAKQRRGKAIKTIKNWRGTCPICKRERVKIVWDKKVDGMSVKCCKQCNAKI